MLSIMFANEKEWWVRGVVFEGIFQTAVEIGEMPVTLLDYGNIIHANSGFDISCMSELDAIAFTKAMMSAARHNLSQIDQEPERTQDFGHPEDLQQFLDLLEHN